MSAGLGPGSTNMTGAQLRQTECGFRCGYLSEGDDLADHERHEHATCPECGREPIGSYPVSHKPGCARLRTRHPVTGIGPANAAPRPSAAPRSPQSAGVAAGDGTDGPEPSQAPEALRDLLDHIITARLGGTDIAAKLRDDLSYALRPWLDEREAMVRAKVAEEIYEADWANIPIWESDEELAEGHFTDRDLTSWLNTLGHAKAHPGCCKSCGCCTTCLASAFFDAVTATAARIARGGQA